MSILLKIIAEDGYTTGEGAHFEKGALVNFPDDWGRSVIAQKVAVAAAPAAKPTPPKSTS